MSLDLSQNKVNIDSQLSTLHGVDGVFYDESYSPLWTKKKEQIEEAIIDKDGNEYTLDNGTIYKNGELLFEVEHEKFVKSNYNPHSEWFDVSNGVETWLEVDDLNRCQLKNSEGRTGIKSSPLFTNSGLIVAARVRFDYAIVLYYSEATTARIKIINFENEWSKDFAWRSNGYRAAQNSKPEPFVTTANNDKKVLYEPIIFISLHDDVDLCCTVCSNAGLPMKTDDFYYDSFIIHNDTLYSTINFSTQSVPTEVSYTDTIQVIGNVTNVTATTNNNPAYSKDSQTFYSAKDETSTQITFDAGYMPAEIEGPDSDGWTTYSYIKNTTTYTATLRSNAGGIFSDIIAHGDFSQSNVPFTGTHDISIPSIISTPTWSYTYNGSTAPQNVQWTIDFKFQSPLQTTPNSFTISSLMLGYTQNFVNSYTATTNITSGVNPNIFSDDDDKMFCLFCISEANRQNESSVLNISAADGMGMPFVSRIDNIVYTSSTASIAYTATTSGRFKNAAYWYRAGSFAVGQNWVREVVTFTNHSLQNGIAQNMDTSSMDIIFDSGMDIVKAGAGTLTQSGVYYPQPVGNLDVDQIANAVPYHRAGSRCRLNDYFNIVFSNNIRVGLSYSATKDDMGTLLTEWNDFSPDTYIIADGRSVYYKDLDEKWHKIEIVENKNDAKLIENKWLVINTTSYFNCYDIEKDTLKHYATDYTNRMIAGKDERTNDVVAPFWSGTYLKTSVTLATTGINSNYLVTGDGISSVSIGPSSYNRLVQGFETFIGCVTPINGEKIDVYYSKVSSNVAEYAYTYQQFQYSKIRSTNSSLIDILYPLNAGAYTLYSPNIFTEYLKTYNNKDSVINGNIVYQLVYANGMSPILLYSTATQLENVQAIFCIQSQYYAISDDKIYALIYSNGTLIESDCIVDITGIQYVGSLTNIAYFYSPMNKTFYSWTGDAVLNLLWPATSISEVYKTEYNTATQTLFVCTDKGILLIAPTHMSLLTDYKNVEDLFFTKAGFTAIKTLNELHYIAYEQLDDEYEIKPMTLETKLFGSNDKENININKYSLTLINHGYKDSDKVSYSVSTLTDIGKTYKTVDSKTIDPDDWDELDQCSIEINVPKNKGAVAISITTPWAIANMVADIVKDGSQVTVRPTRMI